MARPRHPAFPSDERVPERSTSGKEDNTATHHAVGSPLLPMDASLGRGGSRDLAFIGLQAFFCGVGSAGGVGLALLLGLYQVAWWRLPAFLACLSVFHFLEYWTTAMWNVPAVRASSFLLFNNGSAYTAAHALATVEVVASQFFRGYRLWLVGPWTMALGALLVVLGQTVRSVAMAQAGRNFAHIIATEQKEDHELVTDGVYRHLRHPSYFGFFWWALGTQLLVGNKICLIGYAVVLWRFFNHRIHVEEQHLTRFFGDAYVVYRDRTATMIPLIR